jgi:hypothetical protein
VEGTYEIVLVDIFGWKLVKLIQDTYNNLNGGERMLAEMADMERRIEKWVSAALPMHTLLTSERARILPSQLNRTPLNKARLLKSKYKTKGQYLCSALGAVSQPLISVSELF